MATVPQVKKGAKPAPAKKAKKEIIKAVSPVGVAAYAWVNKPDSGHQYSDDKYKVTLVLDQDADLSAIHAKALAAAHAEWGPKVKLEDLKLSINDGDSKDKEEFAGKLLLFASSKFQPTVVDAMKNELPDGVFVMSGDRVKVSVSMFAYEKVEEETIVENGKKRKEKVTIRGVSFQLRGIQLIEKRNAGSNAADDFDEEEGYGADGESQTESSEGNEGDGNGDF